LKILLRHAKNSDYCHKIVPKSYARISKKEGA